MLFVPCTRTLAASEKPERGAGVVTDGQAWRDGLRQLLTVQQAARLVGCSKAHLYNAWINTGRLRVVRIGRAVRVDPEDLAKAIEAAKTGGLR